MRGRWLLSRILRSFAALRGFAAAPAQDDGTTLSAGRRPPAAGPSPWSGRRLVRPGHVRAASAMLGELAVEVLAHHAVLAAVEEVDQKTDHHPDEEPGPV